VQLSNESIAWLCAGAAVLWMLLPPVLSALGLCFGRSHIEDNPSAIEPAGDDSEYEDLVDQLRGLGFAPIGKRTTTWWFFIHHWYKTFPSRVFAAREGDVVAVVYKLRSWDSWRLGFVSAFSDGAIVETANQMEQFRIEEPEYLRWGLATPDRAELLERHRAACREFAAEGARRLARLSPEQVILHSDYHSARFHRQNRWLGLIIVTPTIGLLCAVAAAWWMCNTAPYVLPVCIIVWALVRPFLHSQVLCLAASKSRVADARSLHEQPAR
jgi:hypothetical protein